MATGKAVGNLKIDGAVKAEAPWNSWGMTWDAVTVSLEGAVAALNELTGERVSDAVVDRVFEKFCVGK